MSYSRKNTAGVADGAVAFLGQAWPLGTSETAQAEIQSPPPLCT